MHFYPTRLAALIAAAATLPALAGIDIDSTGATVQFADKTTLQVTNLNAIGYGNFTLRFKWDPNTASFVYDPTSLSLASQSRCVKQVYNTATGAGKFLASSRTVNGIEYGALADIATPSSTDLTVTNIWDFFTLTWARTPSMESNPYLKGQAIANYDPNKAYGFIQTNSSLGFKFNDLVEISGNLETDDYLAIKELNGTNSYILNGGSRRVASYGCSSTSGVYTEHSTTKATVTVAGDSAFYVSSYNTLRINWTPSSASGIVSASSDVHTGNSHDYGGIATNDKVIVQDVGNGFSFASTDANGKVNGSFVIMNRY